MASVAPKCFSTSAATCFVMVDFIDEFGGGEGSGLGNWWWVDCYRRPFCAGDDGTNIGKCKNESFSG